MPVRGHSGRSTDSPEELSRAGSSRQPRPPPELQEITERPSTEQEQSRETPEFVAAMERAQAAMAAAVEVTLDPAKVRVMPDQPRKYFDQRELEALAASMKRFGQLQPGLVRPIPPNKEGHTHEIVDCERRWRAAQMAGIMLRARSAEIDDEAAAFLISVGLNFNRADHTPMEISNAIIRMGKEYGMTHVAIAEVFGYHPNVIGQYKKLQNLVPAVQEMMKPGPSGERRFPVTAAVEISHLPPNQQLHYAQRYLAKEISLGELKHASRESGGRAGGHHSSVSVPDQWRRHATSVEALQLQVEARVRLIGKTSKPSPEETAVGRQRCIAALRAIFKAAQNGLNALDAPL